VIPTKSLPSRGAARKSPLRLAAEPVPVIAPQPPSPPSRPRTLGRSPQDIRQMVISEFGDWLRSRTNRHKRPFQEETISAYRDAAIALSAWTTSTGLATDFTGCDTATLNEFFRW
jgi:hypothetical protein